MGEMTIRLDEALLVDLRRLADRRGLSAETLAAKLLSDRLLQEDEGRWPVARALLAKGAPSPVSAVELLDQIRDEGR